MQRRLYRTSHEAMIFGVCGGIAQYLNWDPTLVRVLFVLGAVVTQGGVVIAYLILAIVMPREPGQGPVTGEVMRESLEDMGQRTRDLWDDVRGRSHRERPPADGEPRPRRGSGDPLIIGVILVLAGIIFLMDSLRLYTWWQFGRLWPLILVGVGIALLLMRRER